MTYYVRSSCDGKIHLLYLIDTGTEPLFTFYWKEATMVFYSTSKGLFSEINNHNKKRKSYIVLITEKDKYGYSYILFSMVDYTLYTDDCKIEKGVGAEVSVIKPVVDISKPVHDLPSRHDCYKNYFLIALNFNRVDSKPR